MRIGVIGTGHVGLVTSVTLSELGHDVAAADIDREKIDGLLRGVVPFYEPGVKELLDRNSAAGRLRFIHEVGKVGNDSDVVFICVGTPPRASGDANMVAVEGAAMELAPHLHGRTIIAEKSTVPAGTSKRLKRILNHARPDLGENLQVVSNPEFLREGHAVEDSLKPDRILVGADSDWAMERMRTVYQSLIEAGFDFIATDIATAELSKHACNAFLALKISYANALANLCELAGADVVAIADIMGKDRRIGREFLNAGLGYGGSCFSKDLMAFEKLSLKLGLDFPFLREIARINEGAVDLALAKITEALWNLEGKRIALLGLSFKPQTDDTRFSPALALGRKLISEEAHVVGYDPFATSNAKNDLPELEVFPDVYDAISGAHCVVLCCEWEEFGDLDFNKVKELMAFPVVVDARNFLDPLKVAGAGLSYYPIGRPPLVHELEY